MESNIILITQARTGSTRLPGKILKKIRSKSLLQIHLDRLNRCKKVSSIIVATTTKKQDETIYNKVISWGFRASKGSENNVLDRFFQAVKNDNPDWIVRVTSDCPLIDPELVDNVINFAIENDKDYVSNTLKENFPDGQDVEVFKFSALKEAWLNASLNFEKEHVTPYIRNNSNFNGGSLFSALNYSFHIDFSKIRMTVDEIKDFKLIKILIEDLGSEKTWLEYTNYLISKPELIEINKEYRRNEGLKKSVDLELKETSDLEIIAEVAQGYEGDIYQTKLFVKAAASSKANSVKFQMVFADELATSDYEYYDLFKQLEFTLEQWKEVADYSNKLGLKLLFDVFGEKSLEFCSKLNVDGIKVHPTDLSNEELIKKIEKTNINKIYLGVGGAKLDEIKNCISILKNKEIVVLLGFQGYPTKTMDNQLKRIKVLNEYLNKLFKNVTVGFADHTDPNSDVKYSICATSIGLGASVIEKHLTLGRSLKIEDYESALNPDEFKEMAVILRKVFSSVGKLNYLDFDLKMSNSEKKYKNDIKKQLVSTKNIKAGSIINHQDYKYLRSSSDEYILNYKDILNIEIKKDIKLNEPFTHKHFK